MDASEFPPNFDDVMFVHAVSEALADIRAADLAIIPGVPRYVPSLQVSPCGASVGVASWTLSTLYNSGRNTAVLVSCPDNLTAWNVRKRKLCANENLPGLYTSQLKEELRFSKLIIKRAPKSVEAWAHRNWTLRRIYSLANTNATQLVQLEKELDLAREMAGKMFANYYAGVHRGRILARIDTKAALREVEASRNFLKTHPKDPSAWHVHRTALTIANQSQKEEDAFASDMMLRYGKNSQSIQAHLKWWARQKGVSPE